MARHTARHRFHAGALIRATTDPGGLALPRDLDLDDEDACRKWLGSVWRREQIRTAVGTSSPALARRVDALVAGGPASPRRVRRAALSLASYLLRWQRRPTPFGLFAGVAPLQIGGEPKARWGTEHRVVPRADALWMASVVERLQTSPELLARLRVVAVDVGQRRGARWVVPGAPTGARSGELAPLEVSVRHTPPVAAALEMAKTPVEVGELRDRLVERFPASGVERVTALLRGLIAEKLLLTSLWAPMTCPDALGHVCGELASAGAVHIDGVRELTGALLALRDGLAGAQPAQDTALAGLSHRMRALSDAGETPLVVDTALDCDVRVPETVVREAEEAVGVLHRLSPHPAGHDAWRDYHGRFRVRYGTGAVIPVLDLVADSGLGFPAGYLGSPYHRPVRRQDERDRALLALVQLATLDGTGEILLTVRLIADLTSGEVRPSPRVEVAFEIHAPTREALAGGSFQLLITGTPRPGSSMAGRFAQLLPAEPRAGVADSYRSPSPDVIAAQLSFTPRRRRNENITRALPLLPHVVPLGEHRAPADGLIPVTDLAVSAHEDGFRLVRLSTGQRVEPRVPHALEAGVHTPPLARFLAEVATARCSVYASFDFGGAARLPYLPRVRYRRTVLAPARWLLTAGELPPRTASTQEWTAELAAWRCRLRVPHRVTLVEHDQRLPLDLTHPVHRLLLRGRLDTLRRLELREDLRPQNDGWLGRAHEVLLPLTLPAAESPSAQARRAPRTAPLRAPTEPHEQLPGASTILHARLHAHPARFDEILTDHLSALMDDLDDETVTWWFNRRRATPRPDADQYLVLCLRLPGPDSYPSAAARLHHWADGLRHERLLAQLTLATHEPQPGRYGHGAALRAAQAVFAADSAAALAQLRATTPDSTASQALTAAAMVDLATRFAPDTDQGLRWVLATFPQRHGPLDRALRDQAMALTLASGRASLPDPVTLAWRRRATALDAYRRELAPQRAPHTVLGALLHRHHVRALGIDPDREQVTARLIRACALRQQARRPR
nr:lantibiotic dehydratase [Streptomyces zhaozhouensis]